MIQTPHLNLSCPDESDYAAFPLILQRIAEDAEAKLVAQRAQLTAVRVRPTAMWWNMFSIGPFGVSPSIATISAAASSLVFSNYTMPDGSLPQFSSLPGIGPFNSAGVWALGVYISPNAVGAVTNDSMRQIRLQVTKQTAGGPVAIQQFGRRVNAESTITVEHITTSAVVLVDAEFLKYGVDSGFDHANAASNMNLAVQSIRIWATRIGTTDAIEVT